MAGPNRCKSVTEASSGQPRCARIIRNLEAGVLTVLFLALLLLGLTQTGLRNLAGTSLPWADAAMHALVLWLAMAGGVVATGRLRHVRVDLVERWLPETGLYWLRRLVFLATGGICLALTWTSLGIVAMEYEFRAVAFLSVPTWVVQLAVPAGFGTMAARFLAWAVRPATTIITPVAGTGPAR